MMNCNHFQLVMLAYNLNCWLMLFNREEDAKVATLQHTTLATARLRFLFLAAKIWRHAGRVGVSYSDHYEEKGIFRRLLVLLGHKPSNALEDDPRPWSTWDMAVVEAPIQTVEEIYQLVWTAVENKWTTRGHLPRAATFVLSAQVGPESRGAASRCVLSVRGRQ